MEELLPFLRCLGTQPEPEIGLWIRRMRSAFGPLPRGGLDSDSDSDTDADMAQASQGLSGKLTDSRRIPKHREETWALGRPGHHERPRRMAGGGRLFREAFSLPADAEPRQQCIHSPRTVRTQQSNSQYVLRGEVTPFYAKEASSLWLGGAAGPGAAAQRGRADACGAPEAPDERYSQHSACVCRCMAVRVPAV